MKELQGNLNATVVHNSNTDLGSNSNLLIFKVIVIVIYYTELGSNIQIVKVYNSNSNISHYIVINPISVNN